MMNFTWNIPTRLHFGKDCVQKMGIIISEYANNVLIVTGATSSKKNGSLNDVIKQLETAKIKYHILDKIKSNPRVEEVREGISIAKSENINTIIAVGGGSAIDSAKAIAAGFYYDGDVWDFYEYLVKPTKALPIVAVNTLAATGSEMNGTSVLQNQEKKVKTAIGSILLFPKDTFCDPTYTLSVPLDYTIYGMADIIAHLWEAFFGMGEATLSDKFGRAIFDEIMEYGPLLINDLTNYEYREKILYASTCALNGLTIMGKKTGDWGVHDIGHHLSLLYDVPHGASLSVVYPAWLKWLKNKSAYGITKFGLTYFNTDDPDEVITKATESLRIIHAPTKIQDLNIPNLNKEFLLQLLIKNKASGAIYQLDELDLKWIIDELFN
jgi:alcohol dehydrogenase YqhD (iron-dependent ADH family)